jgi:hypothetical protein
MLKNVNNNCLNPNKAEVVSSTVTGGSSSSASSSSGVTSSTDIAGSNGAYVALQKLKFNVNSCFSHIFACRQIRAAIGECLALRPDDLGALQIYAHAGYFNLFRTRRTVTSSFSSPHQFGSSGGPLAQASQQAQALVANTGSGGSIGLGGLFGRGSASAEVARIYNGMSVTFTPSSFVRLSATSTLLSSISVPHTSSHGQTHIPVLVDKVMSVLTQMFVKRCALLSDPDSQPCDLVNTCVCDRVASFVCTGVNEVVELAKTLETILRLVYSPNGADKLTSSPGTTRPPSSSTSLPTGTTNNNDSSSAGSSVLASAQAQPPSRPGSGISLVPSSTSANNSSVRVLDTRVVAQLTSACCSVVSVHHGTSDPGAPFICMWSACVQLLSCLCDLYPATVIDQVVPRLLELGVAGSRNHCIQKCSSVIAAYRSVVATEHSAITDTALEAPEKALKHQNQVRNIAFFLCQDTDEAVRAEMAVFVTSILFAHYKQQPVLTAGTVTTSAEVVGHAPTVGSRTTAPNGRSPTRSHAQPHGQDSPDTRSLSVVHAVHHTARRVRSGATVIAQHLHLAHCRCMSLVRVRNSISCWWMSARLCDWPLRRLLLTSSLFPRSSVMTHRRVR